jgi:ADP-dependent NAD(P)H-hydrate dehydratase / NAD(P)H-hydrate epimerase
MQLEPLVTADEIRAAERAHPGAPESLAELMERAGAAVARLVLERFPGRVAVVCGRGANGGDGRVAARLLREAGREAAVVEQPGGLGSPEVVVDALFGTGFHGAPRDDAARLIEEMNGCGAAVVAVDVPSGVDGSTGEVRGAAVRATATVTMEAAKVGLVVAPGRFHAGAVHVAPIGLALAGHASGLVTASIVDAVPRKERETNKYRAGAVLVVGGSRGLTGAPSLTAAAAFRADAGYVTVAAPASALPVLEARLVEAVKRGLPEDAEGRLLPRALPELLALAERAGAVAIGPGLGRGDGTRELVRRLLEQLDLPVVLDADGLWELEPFERAAPTVLTPHAGELARLLGESSGWVDAHRLEAVHRAADAFGCVCLLKGSDTLVAAPGGGVLVSLFGIPALATAGTGDVLTGIVAAFLAKGLEPRRAAAAAAAVHGLAARLHAPAAGLVASDLLATIPRVLAGEASGTPTLG